MKRIAILYLSGLALLFSCNETKKDTTEVPQEEDTSVQIPTEATAEADYYLERIPEIAEKGELAKEFPKAKIETDIQSINEGMDKVKVIWLNRGQTDEVRIDFNPKDSSKVYRVSVEGKKSKFSSKTGIKLGMTIDEVNSINRKPVDFFGFGWDFGGAAKFNNGDLENKNLFVYFKTDKKYGKEFMGDAPHTFEEAKAENLELYVNKIIFESSKSNKL